MLLTLILACDGAVGSDAAGRVDRASVRGVGAAASVAHADADLEGPKRAFATLEGRSGSATTGTVTFDTNFDGRSRTGGGVNPGNAPPIAVTVEMTGASPGNHAVFLHENGDCDAPDASSVGGWFGPAGQARTPSVGTGPATPETGGPPPGYLGFVTVGADGRGAKELVLTAYTLAQGASSLVGRTIVVYERAPDFTRSANPGARQACGIIATDRARAGP